MKRFIGLVVLFAGIHSLSSGQTRREDIYTDFVLHHKRALLKKDLYENLASRTFSLPLDSNTEHKFESACRAVTQFMLANDEVEAGFLRMFNQYDSLHINTRRAFLEAVYGLYPDRFAEQMRELMWKETEPALFAVAALYSHRHNPSTDNTNTIMIHLVEQFPEYDSLPVLGELIHFLHREKNNGIEHPKNLVEFFRHQQTLGQKVIYSFQRSNRDYAGLAIVQRADGRFMRHPDGRLMVFEQLARSASGLPYFITNGNTPQGVYRVLGTAVANNKLIGPTPNLQLIMPFENSWEKYFQLPPGASLQADMDSLEMYKRLLPPALRKMTQLTESFYAGKVGRRAIIAHGTTLDPEYFKDKPFYPLTPTLGCLCAKELWNISNGRLLMSEQLNLVHAFMATPGSKGLLYVIDVDAQQKPVSREEVEQWVIDYER